MKKIKKYYLEALLIFIIFFAFINNTYATINVNVTQLSHIDASQRSRYVKNVTHFLLYPEVEQVLQINPIKDKMNFEIVIVDSERRDLVALYNIWIDKIVLLSFFLL